MKLSEAIRLGSMVGPQAYGSLRERRRTGFLGLFGPYEEATCAIGAAYQAGGITPTKLAVPGGPYVTERGRTVKNVTTSLILPNQWYDTLYSEQWCPVCARNAQCRAVIAHLNDDHRWTREQISAWVASVEVQPEPQHDEAETAVGVTAR